jgi:hypothetical protein
MLEQWEADHLLFVHKVYSSILVVNLRQGVNEDYAVESDDGTEHFLLDVYRSRRNPLKARFQLRYRRDIVLARLCTVTRHTNPDGAAIGYPHLHRYREGYEDIWATDVSLPDNAVATALKYFCHSINLPEPHTQGGPSWTK